MVRLDPCCGGTEHIWSFSLANDVGFDCPLSNEAGYHSLFGVRLGDLRARVEKRIAGCFPQGSRVMDSDTTDQEHSGF